MLHRLEQLAPFPAMSVAVVCSVDAQGDELRPSFKVCREKRHMSNEKNLRCLGYIGDYTSRLCGDYKEPL